MANLLDAIRGNNQALTQKQGMTDETSKLSTLLRAKSGKASGGADVAQSNLGEQQAVAQTNQTMQNQVAPQAAAQLAGAEQVQMNQQTQQAGQEQQIAQSRKFDTIQSRLKTDEILQNLERGNKELDARQQAANMEQLGQNLRLSNTQYIDNLQREGDRSRLNSAQGYQEELARTMFGESQVMLEKNLANKSILSANDRDFERSMAVMGLDTAYGMFRQEAAGEAARGQAAAAGSIINTGIGAYGTSQDNASKKDYYTTGGGKGSDSYEASQYRK